MELLELYHAMLGIFEAKDVSELGKHIMTSVLANDTEKYDAVIKLLPDLKHDWMQKIFQYYQADRYEKKQDFTPSGLASFMASLVDGKNHDIIDMCAGSGALTIAAWNKNTNRHFILYEKDENVIPYLLFNLAIRNISAEVYRSDVLLNYIFETYTVCKGSEFGTVIRGKHEYCKSVKQSAVQPEMEITSGRGNQLSLFAM